VIADLYASLVNHLALERRRLIGAAVARVLLGAVSLEIYLASYAQRCFVWGPGGVSPFAGIPASHDLTSSHGLLPSFSLYFLSGDNVWFEAIYHAGIIVAVLFTVLGGRVLTFANWLFLSSLFERVPIPIEGGDRLARILLLFLCLACSDAYFSPFAARRRASLARASTPTLGALCHNVAIFLCVFQTAVVYLWSGLAKLEGARWLDGTAVYYSTRFDAMHFLPQLDWLTSALVLGALMTYGVLALELLYPILIVLRPTRWLAVVLMTGIHLGIAFKMGLFAFSLVMLAANALVLTDEDYRSLARWFRQSFAVHLLRRRWRRWRRAEPPVE
jgi:hypothetical protein